MASFTQPVPPGLFTNSTNQLWMEQMQKFLMNIAKLNEVQTFTAVQTFANGQVQNGQILLASDYKTQVNVQYVTNNASQTRTQGGNAAIYVQHQIDNTTATIDSANIGIRCQVQSFQQTTTPNNNMVGVYAGVYAGGVNLSNFGVHVDCYHASSGVSSSSYGMSTEMYRVTSAGFTVGYHTRSIDQPGYFDNDYAFLASPSVSGNRKFNSVFAAGSVVTGTMQCNFGLDLRFAAVANAGVYMLDDIPVVWGDNIASHTRRWQGSQTNTAMLYKSSAGSTTFGIKDNGTLMLSTIATRTKAFTGNYFTVQDIAGNIYYVQLFA